MKSESEKLPDAWEITIKLPMGEAMELYSICQEMDMLPIDVIDQAVKDIIKRRKRLRIAELYLKRGTYHIEYSLGNRKQISDDCVSLESGVRRIKKYKEILEEK